MKDLGDEYQGPSKYLSQRDAPLEIPPEVVKKLFQAMDQDLDDRISLQELFNYVSLSGVPIPEQTVVEIF
jgi:Ca2+-binding EF-hand superfamily protein